MYDWKPIGIEERTDWRTSTRYDNFYSENLLREKFWNGFTVYLWFSISVKSLMISKDNVIIVGIKKIKLFRLIFEALSFWTAISRFLL
jgi:hypothetical protein